MVRGIGFCRVDKYGGRDAGQPNGRCRNRRGLLHRFRRGVKGRGQCQRGPQIAWHGQRDHGSEPSVLILREGSRDSTILHLCPAPIHFLLPLLHVNHRELGTAPITGIHNSRPTTPSTALPRSSIHCTIGHRNNDWAWGSCCFCPTLKMALCRDNLSWCQLI